MPTIVRDDFPARVKIGDRQFRRGRVIVDDEGRAVVVVHAASGALETVALGTGAEIERQRNARNIVVRTAEGETWEVERGGGCGCGSPLKRLDRYAALAGEIR